MQQFVWLFILLDIALSTTRLISSSLTRKNLEPTALQETIFNVIYFDQWRACILHNERRLYIRV